MKAKSSADCDNKDMSEGTSTTSLMASLSLSDARGFDEQDFNRLRSDWGQRFELMTDKQQDRIMEWLLSKMNHHQLGSIELFIKPLLQRDFIVLLPPNIAEHVLQNLDASALARASAVSKAWRSVVAHGMLWRKLIEKHVREDSLWRGLSEKRGWKQFLFISTEQATIRIAMARGMTLQEAEHFKNRISDALIYQHDFYRQLYPTIRMDIQQIEDNWKQGKHKLQRINCQSENAKGVYCLQYDDHKIISGLRDNTIKVWQRSNLQCKQVLTGHTGSVLCLQYDDRIIASGSSDATVRIWDVANGEQLNTLIHHSEAVLHLRFHNGMLVTCSKDRSIAVWTMHSPLEIDLRRVLVGHRAAVNVVDFDDTYIVSASGDRTIKVWRTDTCEFLRTLNGHRRGIACLQYRDGLIVSGSSDNVIRLWDIESGTCVRSLEGHEELVRCIRFDNRRIVSGAYDGKIMVWDLKTALDPRAPTNAICIKTLVEHTGRVFRLQFDEFQIVSSSHDDTILIWDFLNTDDSAVPGQVIPHQQQQHQQALMQMDDEQQMEADNNLEMDDAPVPPPANNAQPQAAAAPVAEPELEMDDEDEAGPAHPAEPNAPLADAEGDNVPGVENPEDPVMFIEANLAMLQAAGPHALPGPNAHQQQQLRDEVRQAQQQQQQAPPAAAQQVPIAGAEAMDVEENQVAEIEDENE